MSFLKKILGKKQSEKSDAQPRQKKRSSSNDSDNGSQGASAPESGSITNGDGQINESALDTMDMDNLEQLLSENADIDPSNAFSAENKRNDTVSHELSEIKEKLTRMEASVSTSRSEMDGMRKIFDQTEQNIKKLLGVYEVVQQHINPFINSGPAAQTINSPAEPEPEDLPFDIRSLEAEMGLIDPEMDIADNEDDIEVGDLPFGLDDLPEQTQQPQIDSQELEDDDSSEVADEAFLGEPEPVLEPMDLARDPGFDHEPDIFQQEEDHHLEQYHSGGMYIKEMNGHEVPTGEYMTPSAQSIPLAMTNKMYAETTREGPILRELSLDYNTTVLAMRWIEFMFERVKRDKITILLDYYKDVGWISEEVKSKVMAYARGEIQDVTLYLDNEEGEDDGTCDIFPSINGNGPQQMYKKVEDWRLSAEDHLKSLLFVEKIAGHTVNKDKLNALEQEIFKFKRSLEGYHGV